MYNKPDNTISKIAEMISDYEGNMSNNEEHVDKWIAQFNHDDRDFMARMTYTLLVKGYHNINDYMKLLTFVGDVLSHYVFLDIQEKGDSQHDMINMLNAYKVGCGGKPVSVNDYTQSHYIYMDDIIFTGDRALTDLKKWIKHDAPDTCELRIISLCSHSSAVYRLTNDLIKIIRESDKQINLSIFSYFHPYENRLIRRDCSDVLWPMAGGYVIPDSIINRKDIGKKRFIGLDKNGLSTDRTGFLPSRTFDNEADRNRFERICCDKGFHLISLCENPSNKLRPIGYKKYPGLGFGGTLFTYRNCPNNTPLIFWWGNPDAPEGSPLREWYPLMKRKTYKYV